MNIQCSSHNIGQIRMLLQKEENRDNLNLNHSDDTSILYSNDK